MPSKHRVHPNHTRTLSQLFGTLSPDKQTEYERHLDPIFEQIKKLSDEKTNSPTTPDMFKKSPERLY